MRELEEQIQWETRWRLPVAIASIVSGVLLFAGALALEVGIAPKDALVGLLQGLAPALQGQQQATIDPHTAHLFFVDTYAPGLLLATVITGLGTMGISIILLYIAAANRYRGARRNVMGASFAATGPVLAGLGLIVSWVIEVIGAHNFVHHASRTHAAVQHATNPVSHVIASSVALAGQFALFVAFVLIMRAAMANGLVTRFLGWLGVICGVLFIIPFFPLPLVQTFWLVGMGVYYGGWAGNELPPAWAAGEARTLPTQQEIREERERKRRGGRIANAPAPAPSTGGLQNGAGGKRRKRKKR